MVATSAVAIATSYQASLSYQSAADGTTSIEEQISATIAEENSNGDVFGEAVTIDISLTESNGQSSSATGAGSNQDLAQAVSTLKSGQQQIESQQKKEAAQKLVLAAEEANFLKLLGAGIDGARQAVKIAKDVQAAVQEYAAAGSSTTTETNDAAAVEGSAAAAAASTQAATAGSTPAASTAASAASASDAAPSDAAASATEDSATASSAATGNSVTDPFYSLADTILSTLGSYLHKVLPALQHDHDPNVRKEADQLGKSFADTLSAVQGVEAGHTQTSIANADEAAADINAAASVPVNLVA